MLDGRIVEGGFRPGGIHREWCDAEVLRSIRRKSLARLRKEVEPVQPSMLARLFAHWQGLLQPRRGLDALLDTIENLQGAPLPASLIESSILPARIAGYSPADLDTLIAAGEVSWHGVDSLGEHDGRVSLYLAEQMTTQMPLHSDSAINNAGPCSQREDAIIDVLQRGGAAFFSLVHEAVGGGYPGETLNGLWSLVWRGYVTNDTFHALRAYLASATASRPTKHQHNLPAFRSRRTIPPSAQGRWTLLGTRHDSNNASSYTSQTAWSLAVALQLLNRYGVLTRESVAAENIPRGFSAVYDVLKAMEESGQIRRGYFVAGLGATQFALPAAIDLLRSLRNSPQPEKHEMVLLAATDPANPYGSVLPWPAVPVIEEGDEPAARSLTRSVGASVILRNGELVAYLRRKNPSMHLFVTAEEPERSIIARDVARFLAHLGLAGLQRQDVSQRGGLLIGTINGQAAQQHWMARSLCDAGFHSAPLGFSLRRPLVVPSEE